MNTNEIVGALRICNNPRGHRCSRCPVFSRYEHRICKATVDRFAADAIDRLQKELDAAVGDIPHDCQHCAYSNPDGSCTRLPDGDAFSPDYTEGFDRDNCEHWEWRGRESEGM